MAQEMDSAKLNVKCTYSDCSKYFETEKLMKAHKLAEPEHNYCKKCNVDCKDWEHLTLHKVAAMQPFLDGKMKDNPDELPKHIVCEFCGIDFKSFGGRKLHREQNHKADQHVVCPGCQAVFTRAGNLIAHLEENRCTAISKREFQANIQQKHVIKQILVNPGEFKEILETNEALASMASTQGQIKDGRDNNEVDEGGVTLLEREDEDQKRGYKPLEAEVTEPLTRSNLETWPRLPGQAPSQLTESMRSMSIKSATPSTTYTDMSASEFASDVTSRRGGNKVYTESYLSLSSPPYQASANEEDDTASETSTVPASVTNRTVAWTTGNTPQALFKDAKQTPEAGDWPTIQKRRLQEATSSDNANADVVRKLDPNSELFDIKIFHNALIDKFCCPFPECGDTYDDASNIIGHLQYAHARTSYRCPLCLKLFKSAAALISHAESAGKCKVMKSTKFGQLLNEVSGGFLKAEYLGQKKVYQPKVNEKGEPIEGVMSTKFEAQDARVIW